MLGNVYYLHLGMLDIVDEVFDQNSTFEGGGELDVDVLVLSMFPGAKVNI